MSSAQPESALGSCKPSRREFLAGLAAMGLVAQTKLGLAASLIDNWSGLPSRPHDPPLDFHALANAFDAYVMDPAHGVMLRAKDGRQVFPSALEGVEDGGTDHLRADGAGQGVARRGAGRSWRRR